MGILDRRKKKGIAGFKSYVENLELTPQNKIRDILRVSLLDDPVYTKWAVKNIITLNTFLKLSDEIVNHVIGSIPGSYTVLTKAFFKSGKLEENLLEKLSELHKRKYFSELEFLSEVEMAVRETATFSIIKNTRSLYGVDTFSELQWKLPDPYILELRRPDFSNGLWEIHHENGSVSGIGSLVNYERDGMWKHFYVTGELLAVGLYRGGLKQGKWTFYKTDGETLAEGDYSQDKKIGEWKTFD
jgi:hypothetical protein